MHKAASAFVGSVLIRSFELNGIASVDPVTEAFNAGQPADGFVRAVLGEFADRPHFYGPFRIDTLEPIARTPAIRPIVHVRDVRDCIVSMYYSLAYSHEPPGDGPEKVRFEEARNQLRELGVERYVEEVIATNDPFARLSTLRAICEERGDVVLSKYETMVTDFAGWLDGLTGQVGLTLTRRRRAGFIRESALPGAEDVFSHRRQVTPGDFRRKLSAGLQDRLTEFYRRDLEYVGYL